MRRAWYPVARAQDLESPQLSTILGEELVVFRSGDDGRAVVASNRCPHRGAGIHLGEVHGDTIACPYHGWRYSTSDGTCVGIPAIGDRDVVPSKAALTIYPAVEQWGLVWSCIADPLHGMPDIPEMAGAEWEYGNGEPIHARAGIAAATENFRDVAHFPFVHRRSFGQVPHEVGLLDVRSAGTEVWMDYRWVATNDDDSPLWKSDGSVTWHYHAIAPSFVSIVFDHGDDGRHVLINAARPIGLEECVIYWTECVEPAFRVATLEECMRSEVQIYAEDLPILESLRPREVPFVNPDRAAVEFSTKADRYTLAYRQAFLEFVRRATDGTEDAVESPAAVHAQQEATNV